MTSRHLRWHSDLLRSSVCLIGLLAPTKWRLPHLCSTLSHWDGIGGDGRVRAFMWGPPPEGLCPSALHGCLLHIDSKEKVSVWVTVVKLESICHTVFRAWPSWTALWQDSNVSYLLGLSVIWVGYCMAAHAFTFCPWGYVRVGEAVLKFYSLCVWGRKGVGARPRPDSWESWPADLAACPSPHQQSKRWVHTSHQFSFQLWAAFFSGSDGDKMIPLLILSVFVTHLTSALGIAAILWLRQSFSLSLWLAFPMTFMSWHHSTGWSDSLKHVYGGFLLNLYSASLWGPITYKYL